MRFLLLAALVLAALPMDAGAQNPVPAIQGPSFDCAKARSASARLICSDADLSKMDGMLGVAFKMLLGMKADESAKKAFVAEQLVWIRERNAQCGLGPDKVNAPIEQLALSKTCAVLAIRSRTEVLMKDMPEDPETKILKRLKRANTPTQAGTLNADSARAEPYDNMLVGISVWGCRQGSRGIQAAVKAQYADVFLNQTRYEALLGYLWKKGRALCDEEVRLQGVPQNPSGKYGFMTRCLRRAA